MRTILDPGPYNANLIAVLLMIGSAALIMATLR